jgi:hypothetical protein
MKKKQPTVNAKFAPTGGLGVKEQAGNPFGKKKKSLADKFGKG